VGVWEDEEEVMSLRRVASRFSSQRAPLVAVFPDEGQIDT